MNKKSGDKAISEKHVTYLTLSMPFTRHIRVSDGNHSG
jgi:hypothetical protein